MADVYLSCVKSRPRAGRRVQGGRRAHVNVEQGGRPAGPSGSGYVAKFRASDAVVLLRGGDGRPNTAGTLALRVCLYCNAPTSWYNELSKRDPPRLG